MNRSAGTVREVKSLLRWPWEDGKSSAKKVDRVKSGVENRLDLVTGWGQGREGT